MMRRGWNFGAAVGLLATIAAFCDAQLILNAQTARLAFKPQGLITALQAHTVTDISLASGARSA